MADVHIGNDLTGTHEIGNYNIRMACQMERRMG
jgi:hypothetical protein